MATKKTSIFTLTERLTISAAATDTFATIDLGSYVDVGDRQALQIHSVGVSIPGRFFPITVPHPLAIWEHLASLPSEASDRL